MKSHRLSATLVRHARRGLTLVELMMVITIIAILAVVSFQGYSKFREKAEMVDAMTKMKTIYNSLQGYINQNHQWPQEPQDVSHEDLCEWWMKALEPYGTSQETWFSTAHLRQVNRQLKESGGKSVELKDMGSNSDLKIPSFYPAEFEDLDDALSYKTQPWVMESGEYHGATGMLVVFPDGTIHTMPTLGQHHKMKGK